MRERQKSARLSALFCLSLAESIVKFFAKRGEAALCNEMGSIVQTGARGWLRMLTGITVVDFSRHLSGLICAMRLAELGAEVIEIESHAPEDSISQAADKEGTKGGKGGFFLRSRRKHKSISLNLRTAEGKALAFALARQADVVVESYRPGVLRHLGLDYDRLWEVHPAVVYCSLTGYGQSGEWYQAGGEDLNIQAVSGFLSMLRDAEGRPIVAELPIAEYAAGLYASEQICAALVQRFRTGRGAYLDVAQADLLSSWTGLHVLLNQAKPGEGTPPKGLLSYQVYETADGQFVALAAREEKYWHNFCRAVGRDDWETLHEAAVFEHPDVYEELKALFLTRTQAEWSELGAEADCCLTAVEEADRWAENAYARSREVADSLPLLEFREGEAALANRRWPSWHADHTREVLMKRLKLTAEDVRSLKERGVIPE